MDSDELYLFGYHYFGPYLYFYQDDQAILLPNGTFKGGHCLWQYVGDLWVLKKAANEPGYERGAPPQEKGAFQGELKRTLCRRTPS